MVLKLKTVKEEPKFESTDGKVTKLDEGFVREDMIRVENICTHCNTCIRPGAKVCPICLTLQKSMRL